MERPEIAQFTTLDFLSWRETSGLSLTPKFQRREVWKTPGKSFFMDSILRGIPIPPILIRLGMSEDKKRAVREVIDGQQRLRALLDYIDDKYALTRSVGNANAGLRFSELEESDQRQIREASFLCEVFKNVSDSEVLDLFARVNTYSVGLNAQELRNGRYFGFFKQTAYTLALNHLEFWRRHKVFSEGAIARMQEVEFTSELMVAEIAGQQDKKKAIDKFYSERDEEFPERGLVTDRFIRCIDSINEAVGDTLGEIEFRRAPLLYTLFCVVFHRLFGLEGENATIEPKGRLTKLERQRLSDAAVTLSDKLVNAKQGAPSSVRDQSFVIACQRQTDNIRPRRTRFSRLYQEAFGRTLE